MRQFDTLGEEPAFHGTPVVESCGFMLSSYGNAKTRTVLFSELSPIRLKMEKQIGNDHDNCLHNHALEYTQSLLAVLGNQCELAHSTQIEGANLKG
jgi:hypothetical protein